MVETERSRFLQTLPSDLHVWAVSCLHAMIIIDKVYFLKILKTDISGQRGLRCRVWGVRVGVGVLQAFKLPGEKLEELE